MEYVFIDTGIYEEGLFVESGSLKMLYDAASEGRITILLPEITERETKCHINKRANEEKKKLEKISGSILKAIPALKEKLESSIVDAEHAADELEKLFLDKLQKAKVCRVPIQPTLDVQSIVESYFNLKPPFSDKKSSEFPDAIVLKSLEQWCEENKHECIILSTDGDMKSYSSRFLTYRDLDKYLVELTKRIQTEKNREEEINKIYHHAYANFCGDESISKEIKEWIYEQLDNEVLYCGALCVPDINDYSIKEPSIDYCEDIEVIGSFDETLVFKVIVTVTTEIMVNHPDYDTGYYDGEDQKWYFFDDDVTTKLTSYLDFPVEIVTDSKGDSPELNTINKNHHINQKEIERSLE